MQSVELDIEGIKKILKVEIERSVKHSQYIKLESELSDIKRYETLLNNAIDKNMTRKIKP